MSFSKKKRWNIFFKITVRVQACFSNPAVQCLLESVQKQRSKDGLVLDPSTLWCLTPCQIMTGLKQEWRCSCTQKIRLSSYTQLFHLPHHRDVLKPANILLIEEFKSPIMKKNLLLSVLPTTCLWGKNRKYQTSIWIELYWKFTQSVIQDQFLSLRTDFTALFLLVI